MSAACVWFDDDLDDNAMTDAAMTEAREADLAEAVTLLRSLARRDTCPSCGARDGEACPTDCELTAFLARFPAGVGS